MKKEQTVIRNRIYGIALGIALVCTMLLIACKDPSGYFETGFTDETSITDETNSSSGTSSAKKSYGTISVHIAGQEARTVLPPAAFDKYVYTFTKTGGTATVASPVNGYFTLEIGDYTVKVDAYIGSAEPYTLVASGVSPQFTVGSGSNPSVIVKLSEVNTAGQGRFTYTITYPAGATTDISLFMWPSLSIISLSPSTEGNSKTQTLELASGSYLLKVIVGKNGLYGGISEALHIYPALTTEYAKVFSDDDLQQRPGAAVSAPTGASSVTSSSITINAVTAPGNGQTVEYAISATATAPVSGWQDSTTFSNLEPNTAYYIFARSKENSYYIAGAASAYLQVTTFRSFTTAPTLTLSVGNGSLSYLWTASNPSADSYDIYWKAGSNLTAAEVKTGTKITGASSGGSISALTNGTAYSVVVTANKTGYTAIDSIVRTIAIVPALWACTVSAESSNESVFYATAVDSSGNVYAAGYQKGTSIYTYGTGITTQGTNSGENVVLVKYDSNGTAQWARTVNAGNKSSAFRAVAVDSFGNVFAAGYQTGIGTYTYGMEVSAQATVADPSVTDSDRRNVVLVKYNSSGVAEWARTVESDSNYESIFNAVAVDSSGNVYAAGYQNYNRKFTYGTRVSAQGASGNNNAVLVKYNSSGVAQWARTVDSIISHNSGAYNDSSAFAAIAVDSSNNIYAAGYQTGSYSYFYGTGSTVGAKGPDGYDNSRVVLVKYNTSGTAQWARTVSSGTQDSVFNAVAVDSSGYVYTAGYQTGNYPYFYGDVSARGTAYSSSYRLNNVVLVKYDSSGTALWAQTVSAGNDYSSFNAVAVDSFGYVYAAGYQGGITYTYGTGVSAQGAFNNGDSIRSGNNVVLVKYNSSGLALWAQSLSAGSNHSVFNAVAVDSSGNVYSAGYQSWNIYTYGTGVSAQGSGYRNALLVKYKE